MAIWSRLLGTGLSAAILTACGGAQNQVPASATAGFAGAVAERGATPRDASGSEPLLYVVHRVRRGTHWYPVVSILSLEQDKEVARITRYSIVGGICSDPSGNVWISGRLGSRWHIDEYPPGATTPTTGLNAHGVGSGGCAVDPNSGDLAVVGTNIDGGWKVLIWPGARKGTPAEYGAPLLPLFATYDNSGNLFISGPAGYSISEYYFALGELPKGSSTVQRITLDKPTGHWGAVQWDGTYLVVNTTKRTHFDRSVIYRVQVSGTKGEIVAALRPQGFYGGIYPSSPAFVLDDGSIIGIYGKHGEQLREWSYPSSGKPTPPIARYAVVTALALSNP
jgi:hypothetical protein